MVCVSVVCNLFSTKTESSNQTYLDDAKAQLTEYSDNYNYTKFEFMNSLFEKANVIASVITENTSAETNALLVKNLGINSFVMTDADGKIIASSDDKKVGTNFLDDETTKQFKANLKGMKVKSISEPTAVEGEDGVYNLMACVARTEGGIVIIDTNTSDYSAVIGADIAKSCKGDTIIGVKADMADHISSRKLESAFERTIYSYKKHWGGFKVDNMIFYVLNDFSNDEIESVAEKIQSEKERYISVNKLYVAVSKTNNKLKSLPKTYRIVLRMLRLAVRADMTPMFYDRLEVKKLILAVDDISLLESIYNENLKKLEVYDRDNGTDYMSFLRLYLKYDGSVQRVAQETFVHRNTINYQLAKIKKIFGNNLKTFEERFKIILAFEVRDVL